MKSSELDLGGIWASDPHNFSAAGGGEYLDGRFEIKVYTEQYPYADFTRIEMLRFPAFHLNNTSNSGSLLDAINTNTQSSLKGFTALTFQSSEFIKGVFVDSRDEPLSMEWTLVSAALRPMHLRPWGEAIAELPKITFTHKEGEIVLEPHYFKSSSQLDTIIKYSHMLTFKTKEKISISEFLDQYAGPTLALLKISWGRRIGAQLLNVHFGESVGEIFSEYFEEIGDEKRLDSRNSLLHDDEIDWGAWFDFCGEHRNVAMLLGDLTSGGTGYLQNQILNAYIVLEDLTRIGRVSPNSLPDMNPRWGEARVAASRAAEEFGFGHLVSSRLPRSHPKALGNVPSYVTALIGDLGLNFSNAELTGRVIVGARNPVAHTSNSSDDYLEMITILKGMTSLAIVGLFDVVFGSDIARNAAKNRNLDSNFRDFEAIIPSIVARDFGENFHAG